MLMRTEIWMFDKALLAQRIVQARGALTQTQLGDYCGVTKSAVQQWEDPEGTTPKLCYLPAIARRCGVSTDWLLGLTDTPRERYSGDPLKIMVEALSEASKR